MIIQKTKGGEIYTRIECLFKVELFNRRIKLLRIEQRVNDRYDERSLLGWVTSYKLDIDTLAS